MLTETFPGFMKENERISCEILGASIIKQSDSSGPLFSELFSLWPESILCCNVFLLLLLHSLPYPQADFSEWMPGHLTF